MNILLLSFVYCTTEISNIRTSIRRLHSMTPYSTYYELFGCTEYTPLRVIKKQFNKLMTSKKSSSPMSNEYKEILLEGYDILKGHRTVYNSILNNPYMILDDSANYKTSRFIVFISIVSVILFTDIAYFCIRYVRYCSSSMENEGKGSSTSAKGGSTGAKGNSTSAKGNMKDSTSAKGSSTNASTSNNSTNGNDTSTNGSIKDNGSITNTSTKGNITSINNKDGNTKDNKKGNKNKQKYIKKVYGTRVDIPVMYTYMLVRKITGYFNK